MQPPCIGSDIGSSQRLSHKRVRRRQQRSTGVAALHSNPMSVCANDFRSQAYRLGIEVHLRAALKPAVTLAEVFMHGLACTYDWYTGC